MVKRKQENSSEVLQCALKELGFQVEELVPLPTEDLGDISTVFTGVHEGKKIIIKLGRAGDSFHTEAAALELLQQHVIPCPKPLMVHEGLHRIGRPIIAETCIEGVSLKRLEKKENLPRLLEQTGRILKAMHTIPLDGFGELKVQNEVLRGCRASWQEYVETYESRIQYIFENGFINQEESQRIRKILQEIKELHIPQGFFLHGDVHGVHIFSDGSDITGIIDPGYAMSGDPRKDVAYTHYFLTPQERIHFNEGYGDVANDPAVSKYLLLIAIDKIKYRHSQGFKHRIPHAVAALKEVLDAGKP